GQQLAGGDQHAQGDGQVEGAGVLAQVGGGQVDDGPSRGTLVAQVGQGAFDAVDALAHRQFWQPKQNGFGQAGGRIDLDLDRDGVDTNQSKGGEFGEHSGTAPGSGHQGTVQSAASLPRGQLYSTRRRGVQHF